MNPLRWFVLMTATALVIHAAWPPESQARGNQPSKRRYQALHLQPPDIRSDDWVSLVQTGDLSQWGIVGGTATFELRNGQIIGRTAIGSPSTYLCTKNEFADFELTFETWIEDQLNSGVQVRSIRRDGTNTACVWGPQIEIEPVPDDGSSRCETGYVFSEGTGRGWISQNRVLNDVYVNNQWNRFSIRTVGQRIQVWVNGRKVEDVLDESAANRGFIALQVHSVPNESPALEVRWRDLRIRELR